MAKLTKTERKEHEQAEALLQKDQLIEEERETVFKQWYPAHSFDTGASGVFFTPFDLAAEFRIDVGTGRIVNLCAGIGVLGYWCLNFPWESHRDVELVCVEINPAFVEIRKKLLPDATWICADIFDVADLGLGHFDTAIANPPFGGVNRHGRTSPRYRGSEFAYHVIDIALEIADYGAFILQHGTVPFMYSGNRYFQRRESRKYTAFQEQTEIFLDAGCGIDTSFYRDQWQGTKPAVEFVCADVTEARNTRKPAQFELFEQAA